jgi:spore coat protein CotH
MNRLNFMLAFAMLLLFSCRKDPATEEITDPLVYNSDWTEASHGNEAPDYSVAFPQDHINTIEISIGTAKWASIRTNMKSIYGYDFGVKGGPPAGPPGGGGPAAATVTTEPDYIDVTLKFNGKIWKNTGFRLKGNSTLQTTWSSGIYKLPFRLNFDKFEDTYPGIANQHFYGFKELSFSPGYKDQSLIKEKLTSDLFRLGGVAAPQTAFYRVFIDIGTGSKYWGVYCGVELPDDNMVISQMGEETGNLYKPESNLTSFTQSLFEKKNNETAADYSDVQNFIATLNSSNRISNSTLWRSNLEIVFNVDYFTKWLAINNAIVNWDTYGNMAHNYYLYNHASNKFMWIPWDNNEAMLNSPGITGTTSSGGPGGMSGLSLSMNEVTTTWPLIRYIADDGSYMQKYKDNLKRFTSNVITQSATDALIDKYYSIVEPYAVGVNGEQPGYTFLTSSNSFAEAKTYLKNHFTSRRTLISAYVP